MTWALITAKGYITFFSLYPILKQWLILDFVQGGEQETKSAPNAWELAITSHCTCTS